MFLIDNTIITEELLTQFFCCDLAKCKGECCVSGDAGAPLEEEEIGVIEYYLDQIKEYMSPEGIAVIEKEGVFDYDMSGQLVTPLIDGLECAFAGFDEHGISYCAIEKAWQAGKINFRKPISCHLYPIRLEQMSGFTHLHYHQWDICIPARLKGRKEGIPLYKFLKEALTWKFGEKWYQQLEQIAETKRVDQANL